jgi:ppGpp synthetase/RelA/SpoT-type nucleotidyltranferase
MEIVAEFLARYRKEYDFYDQAARLIAQRLENALRETGIRAIVTSRAKSLSRLEDKIRQRAAKKNYKTVEDIFVDIVDLAGCRVALYFPADREQVKRIVTGLLRVHEPIKEFPDKTATKQPTYEKRFSGYWATHYRVQLRDVFLSESEKRYADARVEVQVASVLMHAWSEVEHDLVYKPLQGGLSTEEYAILDELNGLVMAGEIALERLQKAGEKRIADAGHAFSDQYDLTTFLLSRMPSEAGSYSTDAALGRVDMLYDLLQKLTIAKPDDIEPYLTNLHGDVEKRSIAEQIVDQLLLEDPSRFSTWEAIREDRQAISMSSQEKDHSQRASAEALGAFMMHWIAFERAVKLRAVSNRLFDKAEVERTPIGRIVRTLQVFDQNELDTVDRIRNLRNNVVHGFYSSDTNELRDAERHLKLLQQTLKRSSRGKSGQSRGSRKT